MRRAQLGKRNTWAYYTLDLLKELGLQDQWADQREWKNMVWKEEVILNLI